MSLPSDVLAQTCKRMFTVGLSFAGLWTISFLVFFLLSQQVATMGIMAMIAIPRMSSAADEILTIRMIRASH